MEIKSNINNSITMTFDVWSRTFIKDDGEEVTLWDCEGAWNGETIGAVENKASKDAAIRACKKECKYTIMCVLNNWANGKLHF